MGDLSSIDLQDDTELVRDGQYLAILSNKNTLRCPKCGGWRI